MRSCSDLLKCSKYTIGLGIAENTGAGLNLTEFSEIIPLGRYVTAFRLKIGLVIRENTEAGLNSTEFRKIIPLGKYVTTFRLKL